MINKAYAERFDSLGEYKQEKKFKRILGKLTLDDAKEAIKRAKSIMKNNKTKEFILQQYKGYRYYKENPSLSIWKAIEHILKDCGLD